MRTDFFVVCYESFYVEIQKSLDFFGLYSKNIQTFLEYNLQVTFIEENRHSYTIKLQSSQTDKVRSVGVFCILDLYVADEFVLEMQNRQWILYNDRLFFLWE